MITQECVENILEAADIVEVIGRYVDLKKSGAGYKGLSPFTAEKTPSFMVSPAKQIYKCFSSGRGGNVLTFLQEHKGLSFREAMIYLSEITNISLDISDEKQTVEQAEQGVRIEKLLMLAKEQYSKQIQKSKPVEKYLTGRGITAEDVTDWQLGYSPTGWQFITDHAREASLYADAVTVGLVRVKEDEGRGYDTLRARVTIPIYTHTGKLVGFAGRDVSEIVEGGSETGSAKYVNPKESPIYKKSSILFGMNRAWAAMRKSGRAILVEGYFDVISMHRSGYDNAVAACGTALTAEQAKLLKRYCQEVVLMGDGDKAGVEAMRRNIDPLVEQGLKVSVYLLPESIDPDDWAKENPAKTKLDEFQEKLQDGILWYALERMSEADTDPNKIDKAVADIGDKLALMPSAVTRDSYTKLLTTKIKSLTKKALSEKLNESTARLEDRRNREIFRKQRSEGIPDDYQLSHDLLGAVKWADIKFDVENYSLFMAKNKIWSRRGENPPFYFQDVSNFKIQIMQHMEDEKIPMKLVQMTNVFGKERTFDTRSEDFTGIQSFVKMVTGRGNYNWWGSPLDFQRLVTKLYDDMGEGRMIQVLGWQKEGFFAFSNAAVYPKGETKWLNQYGCFDHEKTAFYIPAGNSIYSGNDTAFIAQKRVVLKEAPIPMEDFFKLMMRVHREHSISAILFSISSLFSDIIYDRLTNFPILFLYGIPSSGKDNLIECCQSLFGIPQSAIQITGKANTDKAKIRKFAQMRNMIVHLSEYRNGHKDTDEWLTSLWDRKGYERGNVDSHVGTDSVPILSSVVFTSNEYPTHDALITRILTEEMMKVSFTHEETDEYEKLKEIVKGGISSYTIELLKLRSRFDKDFIRLLRDVKHELLSDLNNIDLNSRMLGNAAVFGVACRIALDGGIPLPFTYEQWFDHIKKLLKKQNEKRETSGVVSLFFDSMADAIREGKINHGMEYKIEGGQLFIQFKAMYSQVAQRFYQLTRQSMPSKSVMIDNLKKHESYLQDIACYRFGTDSRSSAMAFKIDKTGAEEVIMLAAQSRYNYSAARTSSGDEAHTSMNKNQNILEDVEELF